MEDAPLYFSHRVTARWEEMEAGNKAFWNCFLVGFFSSSSFLTAKCPLAFLLGARSVPVLSVTVLLVRLSFL